MKGEEGEGMKFVEGEGVKGEEIVSKLSSNATQPPPIQERCTMQCSMPLLIRVTGHVTAPLVIRNTNVLYITYHQCCHVPSLSDIKLSPSHSTQCLYCHPAQPSVHVSTDHPHPVTHSLHPSPSPCYPLPPPITLTLSPTPIHRSHCHHLPSQEHKASFSHPYEAKQPTKCPPAGPFDNLLPIKGPKYY